MERHIPAGALGSIATSTYDSASTSAEVVYHHKDHLGGTHVETDDSGAVLEYIVYKPFGGTLSDVKSGTYENDLKYTGKEKDSDTGYYYYGARYYNADVGRFLSQDPVYLAMGADATAIASLLDPQLLNSYSYSRNNPINMIDPDGRWPKWSETALNIFTAVTPIVSDIRDMYESVTGKDMITGEQISDAQMSLTVGALLVPGLVSGSEMRKADNIMGGAMSGMNRIRNYSTKLDNVTVKSYGNVVYEGARDLSSHVDNIVNGRGTYRGTFDNNDGYLPSQAQGYYSEYEIPTPNWQGNGAGPERIVSGHGGEMYYTPDHYQTFTQIK